MILESPHNKKGYNEFAKCLESMQKHVESAAVLHLIDKKFNASTDTNQE